MKKRTLRVAALVSDGPHHSFLIERLLEAGFDVVSVFREPWAAQVARLRRNGRWADWFWWNYHGIRRRLCGLDSYRRFFFCGSDGAPWQLHDAVSVIDVDWINDPVVADTLSKDNHDVVVVMGTSILRAKTLSACGDTTINIHGGCLPYYRGNHCIFFALLDRQLKRIASTLHFVSSGVDAGDLIDQVAISPLPGEPAESLYCRAEFAAVLKLIDFLDDLSDGKPLPKRRQDPSSSKTIRMRDRKPWHDILLWLRRGSHRCRPWILRTDYLRWTGKGTGGTAAGAIAPRCVSGRDRADR